MKPTKNQIKLLEELRGRGWYFIEKDYHKEAYEKLWDEIMKKLDWKVR